MVTKQNNMVILDLGDMEELVIVMAKLSQLCYQYKYYERIELARQIKEKYGISVFEPGILPSHRVAAITINTDCDVHLYIPVEGDKHD
jgi:hypothetical protein